MLPAVLGALCGLGMWLCWFGARRQVRAPATGTGPLARLVRGRRPVHLAAVAVAASIAMLATGWPVAGLLAALATWALPGALAGAERQRARRLAVLDAIATWTESLAATLRGAAGLEQTILKTAQHAPAPIRSHVHQLAAALRGGVPLPVALRAFAVDLDDPLGDTVVAALVFAATEGAGRLADPLQLLAAATREDVSARRRVEKSRAKASTDARIIIATTLAMTGGLIALNRGALAPFGTTQGQVVLAVVGAGFAAGFRWLHALTGQPEPARVLTFGPASPAADWLAVTRPGRATRRGGTR